jgi:hypothetical protein
MKDEDKTGSNRKSFQPLSAEENPQFLMDGRNLYNNMKRKYSSHTNIDLDNILNGLCAALTCLMFDKVDKSDHLQFLQLIHSILKKNL